MNQDEKSYSELERLEDKYVIDMAQFAEIKAEVEKYMKTAFYATATEYVLINTIYLDSPNREFFRHHIYDFQERIKVRFRKYGPNGKWNNRDVFLEIKEKDHEDVRKTRIQLDPENLDNIKKGGELIINEGLETLNNQFYTHSDLQRFISKYNKIVMEKNIKPVVSITYKRLAYGKGNLRVTFDTNLSYKPEQVLSLSNAVNLKKSVDWKTAKEYAKKYAKGENVILEIKHETDRLPAWLKSILEKHNLEPQRFSKYIWATSNNLKEMFND